MNVNITGGAEATDSQLIEIESEKLRQRVQTGLSGIILVRDIELKNIIVMRRRLVADVPMPRIVLPITQVGFSGINLMYDIELFNTLPVNAQNMDSVYATCLMRLKPSILSDVYSADMPVSGPAATSVYTMLVSFTFAIKYCSLILNSVPTIIDSSGDNQTEIIDFSKMGERNLIEILGKVKNPAVKKHCIKSLKSTFVKSSATRIPSYSHLPPEWEARDSKRNYTKYTLPIAPLERSVMAMAEHLTAAQYVHPVAILNHMKRFETSSYIIDSSVKQDIQRIPIHVRVPAIHMHCALFMPFLHLDLNLPPEYEIW